MYTNNSWNWGCCWMKSFMQGWKGKLWYVFMCSFCMSNRWTAICLDEQFLLERRRIFFLFYFLEQFFIRSFTSDELLMSHVFHTQTRKNTTDIQNTVSLPLTSVKNETIIPPRLLWAASLLAGFKFVDTLMGREKKAFSPGKGWPC